MYTHSHNVLLVVDASIFIPLQGDHYRYGSDAFLRNSCWCNENFTNRQPATFIDYRHDLVGGRLRHFYVFVHPSNRTDNVTIRLQIWRPNAAKQSENEYIMKLVWELPVILENDPNGILYTVNNASRTFTCLLQIVDFMSRSGPSSRFICLASLNFKCS